MKTPLVLLATAALLAGAVAQPQPSSVLRVGATQAYHTIQDAVDAAQPGDTVLIDPGVYPEAVLVTTPGLTIEGVDRATVILDGEGALGNGITVTAPADGVTVRTMTARNYASNGFAFSDVDGFVMTDLSAFNSSEYGLYAIHSRHGEISHSYAYGHGDSGFYIGESNHCDCDVHDNEAEFNMLGYSGTANSYLRIHHNDFHNNRGGLLMSVLPTEFAVDPDGTFYGTQVHTEIDQNYIHDNNDHAPTSGIYSTIHPPVGEGITIAGGWMDHVHDNLVVDNHLWGVGLFWLTTPPRGNVIEKNTISGSRYGVWWDEQGEDNCFDQNAITDVDVVSDPAPLPDCDGILPPGGCPDLLTDWAACRASDVRAPSALKDAELAWRAYTDAEPGEDPLP